MEPEMPAVYAHAEVAAATAGVPEDQPTEETDDGRLD